MERRDQVRCARFQGKCPHDTRAASPVLGRGSSQPEALTQPGRVRKSRGIGRHPSSRLPEDTLLQRGGRLRGWTLGHRRERELLSKEAVRGSPAQRDRRDGPVPTVLQGPPGNTAPARVMPRLPGVFSSTGEMPVGPVQSSVLPRHGTSNPRPQWSPSW